MDEGLDLPGLEVMEAEVFHALSGGEEAAEDLPGGAHLHGLLVLLLGVRKKRWGVEGEDE